MTTCSYNKISSFWEQIKKIVKIYITSCKISYESLTVSNLSTIFQWVVILNNSKTNQRQYLTEKPISRWSWKLNLRSVKWHLLRNTIFYKFGPLLWRDFFSDHLLWFIFQSPLHTYYTLQIMLVDLLCGQLFMYCTMDTSKFSF